MPKLIKTIHDMIDFVVDKGHGAAQRRADIDLAIYDSSVSLFEEYLDVYEKTKKIHENLSVFEEIKTYVAGDYSSGQVDKPDNYRIYTLVTTDLNVPVDVVSNSEWGNRINSSIDFPTAEYPIARIGKTKIDILPDQTPLKLYHLTNPPQPLYAVDNNGDYVDAGSVDVGWGPGVFVKLVTRTLSKLGINLREEQIIQYSERMKATEPM